MPDMMSKEPEPRYPRLERKYGSLKGHMGSPQSDKMMVDLDTIETNDDFKASKRRETP
jgi:hypothetical protein